MTVTLQHRGVSCRVQLLDEQAPATCQAVRVMLPVTVYAYRGLFTRHVVDAQLPRTTPVRRRENPTVSLIHGYIRAFDFEPAEISNPPYGYTPGSTAHAEQGATDVALFYVRNNLLV